MNDELLKRIAHHLYADTNFMYAPGMVNDDLLLSVGKAFNRLYHNDKSHEMDDDKLLISVCCNSPDYFTHGQACAGCADMAAPTFENRVNEIMATALLRELREKGADVTQFAERRNRTSRDKLPELIIDLNKALRPYYPIASLESLSAKAAVKNKSQWRHSNVVLPGVLFDRYRDLEIDPERLVAHQLHDFLAKYKPEALEASVLLRLSALVCNSNNLYADAHQLLNDTNYKDYAAYLRINFSKPLISIMKKYKNNPDELAKAMNAFIKGYKPQSVETIYLHHLIVINNAEKKSALLEKLLAKKSLTERMNDHLLQILRKPIVDILKAKEALASEQARPH